MWGCLFCFLFVFCLFCFCFPPPLFFFFSFFFNRSWYSAFKQENKTFNESVKEIFWKLSLASLSKPFVTFSESQFGWLRKSNIKNITTHQQVQVEHHPYWREHLIGLHRYPLVQNGPLLIWHIYTVGTLL